MWRCPDGEHRPAADAGLPTIINRRSALAKFGMGLATSASLAATAIAAPAGVSPELLRLIEAHKAAKADDLQTHRRLVEAHQVYWAMKPEAPGFIDIFAERPRDCPGDVEQPLDMKLGREECKKRVVKNLVFHRMMFAGKKASSYVSPQRQKQINAASKAIEKESLATIDAYFDTDEAARKSAGMEAASIDCKRTIAAEMAAMQALCSYRYQTLSETRIRASYLASDDLAETIAFPHFSALLRSSCVEA